MNVICLEDTALDKLIREVSNNIIASQKLIRKEGDEKYCSPAKAMAMLGVKSATTLKKYFDEGHLERFEYNGKIRYSLSSIDNFMKEKTTDYGD